VLPCTIPFPCKVATPRGSPDSGTCGNEWAEDTFDRVFFVSQRGPTSYTVVEQFKNGAFITDAGFSLGACDSSDGTPPGTVGENIHGTMHGYLIISVTGTQTSSDSACIFGMPAVPCTTTGFIESHFTGAAFTVGTFFFHYAGYDGNNQQLVVHEWKNASADRGCNHGDIATAILGSPPPFLSAVCP
jgi:hypothetical protein